MALHLLHLQWSGDLAARLERDEPALGSSGVALVVADERVEEEVSENFTRLLVNDPEQWNVLAPERGLRRRRLDLLKYDPEELLAENERSGQNFRQREEVSEILVRNSAKKWYERTTYKS